MEAEFRWDLHPAANVKLEAPITWPRTEVGDNKISITSPEREIELELLFLPQASILHQPDEDQLLAHVKERLTDVRVVKPPAPKAQHGLDGFGFAGYGLRGIYTAEWFTFMFSDGKGHGLIALALCDPARFAAQAKDLIRVIGSIQPIDASPVYPSGV
jgi:hypothetical protein